MSKENEINEKLIKTAKKRQQLLFKMEKVIAELDCIKRSKKAIEDEMQGLDNYLMRGI